MKLDNDNYFSKEMSMKYTGSSQIKDFIKCEKCALEKLKGNWEEKQSEAMKVSSYIDAWMSDELDYFKELNPEIFTRQGELKAQYKIAEKVIEQIEDDPMFMKYISGEHQMIITGEISGTPVKIKVDSYFPNEAIVDLKCMGSLDLIWNDATHQKENFIEYYDYILQAALYQEIVRQNTGKQLPFIIAVATKKEYSERALLAIPQDEMNLKLEFLKNYLPHLQDLKDDKVEPVSCNHCDYCLSNKKTNKIYDYNFYFTERGK